MKFDSTTKYNDRKNVDFNFEEQDIQMDLDIECYLDSGGSLRVDYFNILTASRWCEETNKEVKVKFNKIQKLQIETIWIETFKSDVEYYMEKEY